jgi:hypothetical protein
MRALAQFVFVAFYFVSSLATTQDRLDHITTAITRCDLNSGAIVLIDNSDTKPHYTHFREAKRVNPDVNVGALPLLKFLPAPSMQGIHLHTLSFKSQFEFETSPSRAPPAVLSPSAIQN